MENRNETIIAEFSKGTTTVMKLSPERGDIGNIITLPSTIVDGREIKAWGSRNDLPEYRDRLLADNNIIPELINTKRDIALGRGLQAYEDIFVDGVRKTKFIEIPKEISTWLKESQFHEMFLDLAFIQWYKHSNVFAEFVMSPKGVSSVMCRDCRYIRAEKKKDGKIPGYVYNPNWRLKYRDEEGVSKAFYVQTYNPAKKQAKFMVHVMDNVFDDGYYASPAYWGGVEWIRTSNAIPKFHEANLKNGYSMRFLISYPEDYFLNKMEYDAAAGDPTKVAECLDKEAQSKQSFIDRINELLSGVDNAGRAVFVQDMYNHITNEYAGIKIQPIEFDMKDEALLSLYEKTNQANISGQGIHPTLANIESQGKLSSGSEMRNAFLFYILTKTPRPRRKILKVLDLVMELNGWAAKYPALKWTFEDFHITTLDDEKSGVKPTISGTDNNNNEVNQE